MYKFHHICIPMAKTKSGLRAAIDSRMNLLLEIPLMEKPSSVANLDTMSDNFSLLVYFRIIICNIIFFEDDGPASSIDDAVVSSFICKSL